MELFYQTLHKIYISLSFSKGETIWHYLIKIFRSFQHMPIFSWILCLKYYLKSCFGLFTKTRNFKKNSEITQCTMHMVNRHLFFYTVCPNKHWNWVTNSRSSLLRISIVIPDIKSHYLIMPAIVYFMKTKMAAILCL